ncbi:hypothetical protein EDB92DRAFT_1817365 [Lactarius akahatsu]|uniref:Uncharacterized protein n=1 Tax=Lactarius akahatsu TaxID=416441 RepID=A0AAD4Q6V9_9AGAM|nr:hypothetical protein EDB92DRAFT_1817365 [Lactarius akahatsu]
MYRMDQTGGGGQDAISQALWHANAGVRADSIRIHLFRKLFQFESILRRHVAYSSFHFGFSFPRPRPYPNETRLRSHAWSWPGYDRRTPPHKRWPQVFLSEHRPFWPHRLLCQCFPFAHPNGSTAPGSLNKFSPVVGDSLAGTVNMPLLPVFWKMSTANKLSTTTPHRRWSNSQPRRHQVEQLVRGRGIIPCLHSPAIELKNSRISQDEQPSAHTSPQDRFSPISPVSVPSRRTPASPTLCLLPVPLSPLSTNRRFLHHAEPFQSQPRAWLFDTTSPTSATIIIIHISKVSPSQSRNTATTHLVKLPPNYSASMHDPFPLPTLAWVLAEHAGTLTLAANDKLHWPFKLFKGHMHDNCGGSAIVNNGMPNNGGLILSQGRHHDRSVGHVQRVFITCTLACTSPTR